jgi:hypothetical protein
MTLKRGRRLSSNSEAGVAAIAAGSASRRWKTS